MSANQIFLYQNTLTVKIIVGLFQLTRKICCISEGLLSLSLLIVLTFVMA